MAGVLVLLLSEISYTLSEPHAGGLPRGGVGLPNGKPGVIVALGTWHRQPEGQRSAAAPADASQGPISCGKIGKPLLGSVQIKSKKCGNVGCPLRQLHSSFYSIPLCNSLGPRSEGKQLSRAAGLGSYPGPSSQPPFGGGGGGGSVPGLGPRLRRQSEAPAAPRLGAAAAGRRALGRRLLRCADGALPAAGAATSRTSAAGAVGTGPGQTGDAQCGGGGGLAEVVAGGEVGQEGLRDSGEAVPWKEGLSRSMCRVPLRIWNLYHSCCFDGG